MEIVPNSALTQLKAIYVLVYRVMWKNMCWYIQKLLLKKLSCRYMCYMYCGITQISMSVHPVLNRNFAQICFNTVGSCMCLCRSGYALNVDGRTLCIFQISTSVELYIILPQDNCIFLLWNHNCSTSYRYMYVAKNNTSCSFAWFFHGHNPIKLS